MAACAQQGALRAVGLVAGDVGGVAADEPRAAVVAREVLGIGGNAVDAAVALYFTTAVTFPASSSLGAGGACLVFDPENRLVEALEFPALAPPGADSGARLRVAVPAAPRAMFALHARYGRLPWAQLVGPAEQLARLGHPVSRALARDIARVSDRLFVNPYIAAIFGRADGKPLGEGDTLVQLELAAVLTQLRTRGPGVLYSGELAHRLVAGVNEAGGSFDIEGLRGYRPAWRETMQLPFGLHTLHTVPPPLPGGVNLFQMWAMLTQGDRYADAGAEERAHLIAEASMRAFADRGVWRAPGGNGTPVQDLVSETRIDRLMASYRADRHVLADQLSPPPQKHRESPSGTSFVVVDGNGGAVACALTLNNFFGRGWIAPGTGIIMAAATGSGRGAMTSLAPVMMVNPNTGNFLLAAAASGGAAAPSSLIEVMTGVLLDDKPLAEAVAAPRLYHGGRPDVVLHESDESPERLAGLRRRGHVVARAPQIGRVNAVFCRDGFLRNPAACVASNDRRGHGLASLVQF